MPRSPRFITLTKELNRLKKQFLPKTSPTGEYRERQLALTIAYRVLAHAEIEAYLEDRAKDVAIDAKKNWDSSKKASRVLKLSCRTSKLRIQICLLPSAFSHAAN